MKRTLSLIIAVLMIIAVFSACGNGTANTVPADITEDGNFVFSITRSAEADTTVESVAKDFRTSLKKGLGCNILILKDTVEDYDGNYEILIGLTNREESVEAYKKVKNNRPDNSNDFIVRVTGEKICLTGATDIGTKTACEWFIKTFGGSLGDWAKLKNGYEFFYTPENDTVVNTVAGENIGAFTVVTPLQQPYIAGRSVNAFVDLMGDIGYPMAFVNDHNEEKEYEILFGGTEREVSKATEVSGNDFIIKLVGKKLVVKGGNEYSNKAAADYLVGMLKNSLDEGKGFNLEDGFVYNGKYDPDAPDAYVLNFDEEFNGSTLNTKLWSNYGTDFGGLTQATGSSTLGGKRYCARYDDGNFYKVSDGTLKMVAKHYNENDFIVNNISTCYSMVYRYGFWEVRCKLPDAPCCLSMWTNAAYLSSVKPAVGSMDRVAFTEVDLIESFGSNNSFASNVHRWYQGMDAAGNVDKQGHTSCDGSPEANTPENSKYYKWYGAYEGDETDLSNSQHIYSYYWDDEVMEFAFDGKRFFKYNYAEQNDNSVSIHCMQNYLIISQQLGEPAYGARWSEGDPEVMIGEYDWCRIYQTANINSQMRYGDGYKSDRTNYTGTLTYVYDEQRKSY